MIKLTLWNHKPRLVTIEELKLNALIPKEIQNILPLFEPDKDYEVEVVGPKIRFSKVNKKDDPIWFTSI